MNKPNLNKIIAANLEKDKFQSKSNPSLPVNGWLNQYKDGGVTIQTTKRPDTLLEDMIEVFDPTGISSWDDIYRSYKKSGIQGDTPMEILGAIPIFGKLGKLAKANKALAKTSRQAKSVNNFINATKAASITGRASDASQLIGGYAPNEILPEYKPNSFELSGSGPKYAMGGGPCPNGFFYSEEDDDCIPYNDYNNQGNYQNGFDRALNKRFNTGIGFSDPLYNFNYDFSLNPITKKDMSHSATLSFPSLFNVGSNTANLNLSGNYSPEREWRTNLTAGIPISKNKNRRDRINITGGVGKNFMYSDPKQSPDYNAGLEYVGKMFGEKGPDVRIHAGYSKYKKGGGYFPEYHSWAPPRMDLGGPGDSTQLTPIEQKQYEMWKSKLPKNLQWEGDYDLKGLWKSNPKVKPSSNLHFPDTYKLPNHPTFSNESKYYDSVTPGVGGYWGPGEENFIKNPNIGPPVPHAKNGGDISIPDLDSDEWLTKYSTGGFGITTETTWPHLIGKHWSRTETGANGEKTVFGHCAAGNRVIGRNANGSGRAWDRSVARQAKIDEQEIASQKAKDWADYTNIGLDAYGNKYDKKDKTFLESYNKFITANPNFAQEQSTLGLSPEQRYAMIYKMAGRSVSPDFIAPKRLRTYMGLPEASRFTDQQLYEAAQKMGGIDKYADWWKNGWGEIKKHGGVLQMKVGGPGDSYADMQKKSLQESVDFLKDWYTKRATLPEFKDVSERRLALLDKPIDILYEDPDKMFKQGYAGFYNIPNKQLQIADPNSPSASYPEYANFMQANSGSPLLTHEIAHKLQMEAPYFKDVIPDKIKNVKGYRDLTAPIFIDLETGQRKFSKKGSSTLYPEMESYVGMLRQAEGIDPTKPVTPEMVNGYIEKYNKYKDVNLNTLPPDKVQDYHRGKFIQQFFESLGNDPEVIAKYQNSVAKNTQKDMSTAKYGGWLTKYGPGGVTTETTQPPFVFPSYTMPLNRTDAPGGITIQEKQKQDADALEMQRRNEATAKRQFIGQGKASTPESEARRKRLNQQYASQQPNAQYDEQTGEVSRVNPNRSVTGEAENFMSRREDKAGQHVLGALEAAGAVEGLGALGSAGKKAIAQSMESGLLSNTSKINPFAGTFAGESKLPNFLQFNKLDDPNAFYRLTKDAENYGLGKGAYFNKGVPLTGDLAETFPVGSRSWRHRYSGPKWNPATGKIDLYSGPDYLFKTGNASYMEPHLDFPESHLEFYRQKGNIPTGDVQLYKKDWLQGWKEIPQPAAASNESAVPLTDFTERNARVIEAWFNAKKRKAGIPPTAAEYMEFLKKNPPLRKYTKAIPPDDVTRLKTLAEFGNPQERSYFQFGDEEHKYSDYFPDIEEARDYFDRTGFNIFDLSHIDKYKPAYTDFGVNLSGFGSDRVFKNDAFTNFTGADAWRNKGLSPNKYGGEINWLNKYK